MITFAEIKAAVADYYGLSVRVLESPSRMRIHSRPRHVAMYLGRQLTKLSTPQIGKRLGDRDHSTIIHGISCIEYRKNIEPELAFALAWLEAHLLRDEHVIHNPSTVFLCRSLDVPAEYERIAA